MGHGLKFLRAYRQYRNTGMLDREYIESLIPNFALKKLSSDDLIIYMDTLEKAYYDGKNSPKE